MGFVPPPHDNGTEESREAFRRWLKANQRQAAIQGAMSVVFWFLFGAFLCRILWR